MQSGLTDKSMLEFIKTLLKLRIAKLERIYRIKPELEVRDINSTDLFLNLLSYHFSRKGVNGLHIYHIIKPSKWPALISIVLFGLAIGFVMWVIPETTGILSKINLNILFISFLSIFYFWCFDLMNESGEHNKRIRQGIKMGMILFIISEFMFFFAFFWAYLHSSTNPSIEIGHVWPPFGQAQLLIDSISLPLLNTLLLLTSGFCVTLAHKFSSVLFTVEESLINLTFIRIFKEFNKKTTIFLLGLDHFINMIFKFNFIRHSFRIALVVSLGLTITLALIFTNIQYNEYVEASFNISDGIYASCFYLMTGFHGIHVMVGTIFLIACFIQLKTAQNFYKEMTGLECAIWYWHFVDVVWLFLYIIVYLIADDAYNRQANINLLERLSQHEKSFNSFMYGCFPGGRITGFAAPNQKYFNFPATTSMSEIIWLHDYIMFFIIVILFIVLAIFYGILREYTTVLFFEKYLKFAQYRADQGGHIYKSKKGDGFVNLEKTNINEEGLYRTKNY